MLVEKHSDFYSKKISPKEGSSVYFCSGGGVFVGGSATMEMTGGEITENRAEKEGGKGGGVGVNGGKLILNDGKINKNYADDWGGGVLVCDDNVLCGEIIMNGGSITENEVREEGGGVCITNSGVFTMNDGTISGNKANWTGGSIYLNVGGGGVVITTSGPKTAFIMTGGSIANNTVPSGKPASGVAVAGSQGAENAIDFEMSGSACIDGSNELYLELAKISVPNAFTSDKAGAYDIVLTPSAGAGTVVASASDSTAASEALKYFTLNAKYAGQYDLKVSNNDIVLSENEYTVSFNSNGGSPVDSQTVKDGDRAEKPTTDPVKEGATFEGWYTDNGTFEHPYDFNTPVTSSFTLYVKWDKAIEYITVEFNANGGRFVDGGSTTQSIKCTVGDEFGSYFPNVSRTGYLFDGWYTQAAEGDKIEGTTVVESNSPKNLYAHWTPITYTIQFDANGGEGTMSDQPATYDKESILIRTPLPNPAVSSPAGA